MNEERNDRSSAWLLWWSELPFWWLRLTCPAESSERPAGVALAGGAALALAGAGGGAAVIARRACSARVAVTGLWLAFATRKALADPPAADRVRAARRSWAAAASCAAGRTATGRCSWTARSGGRGRAGRTPRTSWRRRRGRRRARERADARSAKSRGVGGTLMLTGLSDRDRRPRGGRRRRCSAASVRILREYERGVVFRLGRVIDEKGPGLVMLIPAVDRMVRVTPPHGDAADPAAGGDHARQRPGAGRRGRVLPRDRPAALGARRRGLHGGDAPDRADDAALGARQGRARRAALRARAPEREPPADHRRADRAVGHQGHDRRDQGRGDPRADAAGASPARRRPSATGARR